MLNYVKILLVINLLLLISCNSNQSLENNSTVLEIFSKEEAQGLQKIHDFFASQICDETGLDHSEPIDCYDKFMEDMKVSGSTGSYVYVISRNEIDGLFSSIDSSVFSTIWTVSNFIDLNEKKHERTNIDLHGKYSHFLLKVGEEDEVIKEYHEDLLHSGLIGASSIAKMLMLPERYDIQDCRIRLIIAIHYLTTFYNSVVE